MPQTPYQVILLYMREALHVLHVFHHTAHRQLLDDTARRKLRKEFLDRKKQIKEQESKKQLNSKEPNDGI